MDGREKGGNELRGFVTGADLPQAESEWPGLQEYLRRLPLDERPTTFLELVWRFERWRQKARALAA
jgi:hypothetical protein